MSEGPVNGTPPGEPDPRLQPVIRIVVEVKGSSVAVQTNCPENVAINAMTAGIVALAQKMVRDENKSLVKPVSALRRLPNV